VETRPGAAGTLSSAASIAFVVLCAMDSAVGNMVTVPFWWLLGDAAVGVVALGSARRGHARAGLAMSAISNAACGVALHQVSKSAAAQGFWRGQIFGAIYVILALLRWQWPWIPNAPYQRQWWGLALVALTVECFVAWGAYFGAHHSLVRSLCAQNEALEREKQADIEAAQVQERLIIAREMHDVLAHRLSLISMHSAALEHRTAMDDAERIRAGALIRANARASLSELRGFLSDLRDDHQPHGPQPDEGDLPRLAVESSTPDHPVHVDVDLQGGLLPPGAGRHVFRITQEAVTNARKHGAPGLTHVTLCRVGRQCVLTVTNPLQGPATTPPGVGLRGITERVHICGGALTRIVRDGVHTLQISIPLQEGQ